MNILVTGGAGFIGRWVVKELLRRRHKVWALDNLSNGSADNLREFTGNKDYKGLIKGDITDAKIYKKLKKYSFQKCFHLAARVVVHDSLLYPRECFQNDVSGVFLLLEFLRKHKIELVFVSSCMVYDMATAKKKIDEDYPVKPASPYAAFKLAGENMSLSYWNAYKLPVTVLRPFNTYGPFQKATGEGGVVAIFIKSSLENKMLGIYGSGKQTRDFLYVEDCARFICKAGFARRACGHIINAGSGRDISINDLAVFISRSRKNIRHLPHIHPQSEIMKLACDRRKAQKLISWKPKISLAEGIKRTRLWMKNTD